MLNGFFPHHQHDDDLELASPVLVAPFHHDAMSHHNVNHLPQPLQIHQHQPGPPPPAQTAPPQHPHGPQYSQHPPQPPDQPLSHRGTIMDTSSASQSQPYPPQQQQKPDMNNSGDIKPPNAGNEDKKPSVTKPVKTLNRVPRACNACRKQKMRCEGAENPPCRRCRHAGLECLFEKPSREPTLTGEAGLERIRSLESQVSEIRTTQHNIHATLLDLVNQLRSGQVQPSPHPYRPSPASPYNTQSPASASTVTQGSTQQQQQQHGQQGVPSHAIDPSLTGPGGSRPGNYPSSSSYPRPGQAGPSGSGSGFHRRPIKNNNGKRIAESASNSSDEEDAGGPGELPASGLVAPWEVLRGLADAAAERAAKENGVNSGSEPASRARTHSPPPHQSGLPGSQQYSSNGKGPQHQGRGGHEEGPKLKRRKTHHRHAHGRQLAFPDVVTMKIITEQEARELFEVFYRGCSTFLPVFDAKTDTFDALHDRSPFAVDCICMIAARVKSGGGPPSELYDKIAEEVRRICCATLFSPVTRQEAVQAMVLVSGWSDNGWLTAGHAVRMGLELGMSKAWPRLLRRIKQGKMNTSQEERELVISVRTWFVLYLFEHQMSYGNGQPAILRYDESIRDCRMLLQHPLSIEDDMRLVSMVELIVIREQVHNRLTELDRAVNDGEDVEDQIYDELRRADHEFRGWYQEWDQQFGQRYPDATFYRQSLQVQQYFAELFHNATALRGIHRPEDVQNMPEAQRMIAIRSIQIAKAGLETSLKASAYRESLKYAVHYTHATVTFAASLLIRLARLIPQECDLVSIRKDVEELANVLEQTPSQRYARSLRYMLRKASERHILPDDKSAVTRLRDTMDITPPIPHASAPSVSPTSSNATHPQSRSPTAHFNPHHHPPHMAQPPHPGMHVYPPPAPNMAYPQQHHGMHPQHYQQHGHQPPQQQWYDPQIYGEPDMHVWANMDLNANAVMNSGMEAYIIPPGYADGGPLPQIW